jgi:hypothetical protein
MNCDILEQLLTQQFFNFVIIIELETPQHNIKTLYGIQALGKNILKNSSDSHVTSHMASDNKVNTSCPLQHCRYMQAEANVPLHNSSCFPFIT